MKHKVLYLAISAALSSSLFAADSGQLQKEIDRLQKQTQALQSQLNRLQKQLVTQHTEQHQKKVLIKIAKPKHMQIRTKAKKSVVPSVPSLPTRKKGFHKTPVEVHTFNGPESKGYYPTALIAEGQVLTYIAGTPVVSSPYLGAMPAFDGSDYIVNISSINRDIRLMQQRRRLYQAYEQMGYQPPNVPIIALSGKVEPVGMLNRSYFRKSTGDLSLGSSEIDVAATLNNKVEAFMAIAYDDSPSLISGQRVSNSAFNLNMGFVNIGNLEQSPFYFTAGQLYVPFGRYSSSMISSPLTQRLARTKARPFIIGYKSQYDSGPYAAAYAYRSDTAYGRTGVGGVNLGYMLNIGTAVMLDLGASYIGTLADSNGMQNTTSVPWTTFGGFGSLTNGSECVRKVPGVGVHGSLSVDRYNVTAEWVGATTAFRPQELSYNGHGAQPQAAQLEAGVTFMAFSKPASFALGYQWSQETLALNIPEHRFSAVFNISLWKDTVESLEYRHDVDFNTYQYANGIAPPGRVNLPTLGTGRSADALLAQIGVYF